MLDESLPLLTANPAVTQINPPGANGKGKLPCRMVFGKYMDDPEGDGQKSKKKAAKKKESAAGKDKAEPEADKVEENEPIFAVEPPRHTKGTH